MDGECELGAGRANVVPTWHPVLLVVSMLSVAIAGIFLRQRGELAEAPSGSRILQAYLPLLVVNCGLFLYVCRVGRSRSALQELVGLDGYSARRALLDALLGLGVASALVLGELGWQLAVGDTRNAHAAALLPVTTAERAVWCAVALSSAFSEEVVYRGYLTRELARLSGRPLVGVLGQAVLFALAHGEQGSGAMVRFFVYALGLASLALARRSLVPGIIGHAGVDLLAGFVH